MRESIIRKLVKQMKHSVIPSEQNDAMVKLLNFLIEPHTQPWHGVIFLEMIEEKESYAVFTRNNVQRVELTGDMIHITQMRMEVPETRIVYGDFEKVCEYFSEALI